MGRIPTMAARHVAELRKVQPHGPYRLAGFCVGGIIAFEMARQLRAAGEAVDRLIIVDSSATNARIHSCVPCSRSCRARAGRGCSGRRH